LKGLLFCEQTEAREIFGNAIATIEQHWETVCEEAELNEVDKKLLWRGPFLHPYSLGK
jgi:serine/threonine-protein kinase HipA